MSYLFVPLFSPLVLLAAAVYAARNPGKRPGRVPLVAELAALAAFGGALVSSALLAMEGPGTSALVGALGIGISVRLDVVSVVMLVLVSFIGWIVLRYARTYMDGEERQGAFTAWMAATLATVLLLVMAGNLVQVFAAWVMTSLLLNQLLLHYPERATAQRAARKKAFVARLSEVALAVSFVLLVVATGTTDIATILESATATWLTMSAALFLAIAAVLASAQFPMHGWLTEVMEAPTTGLGAPACRGDQRWRFSSDPLC